MNNFKRACSIAGVTGSAKASLEECIDGLKQLIRTEDDEDGLEVLFSNLYSFKALSRLFLQFLGNSVLKSLHSTLIPIHTILPLSQEKNMT